MRPVNTNPRQSPVSFRLRSTLYRCCHQSHRLVADLAVRSSEILRNKHLGSQPVSLIVKIHHAEAAVAEEAWVDRCLRIVVRDALCCAVVAEVTTPRAVRPVAQVHRVSVAVGGVHGMHSAYVADLKS